jgi:hypothetical protein
MKNKYLIVKGCAGLGNRLVTILAAVHYARRNNRKLIVDWEDGQFDKFGVNAFYKTFDLKNVDYLISYKDIQGFDQLSHSSELFRIHPQKGIYELYFQESSKYFLKLPERFFPKGKWSKLRFCWKPISWSEKISSGSDFNAMANVFDGNCLVFGDWLKNRIKQDVLYYVDFLPNISFENIKDNIQPKEFIWKKVNEFACDHNFDKDVTGVHVRSTDKRPNASIEKFVGDLKEQKKTSRIYLSTDSQEVEDLFKKIFPDLILYPKFKPKLDKEGLHQWALYNNAEDLKYRIYEDSLIEMLLLSRANYLYYQGNSTFSKISRVFHQNVNQCYDWQS